MLFDLIVCSPPFMECLGNAIGRAETKLVRPNLPPKEEVANYLRQRRIDLGLTAKDVAKHFPSKTGGITGCVWNWENGENMPTPEEWLKLKEILQLDNRFDEGILTVKEVDATGKYTTDQTGHAKIDIYGKTEGQLGSMKSGNFNPGATMNKEKTRECVFDEWNGLYSEGWQGVIVEDAFAH